MTQAFSSYITEIMSRFFQVYLSQTHCLTVCVLGNSAMRSTQVVTQYYLFHLSRTLQIEVKVIITRQQSLNLLRTDYTSDACLQSIVALECFKIIASMARVNVTDCHLAHHS